MFDLGQWQRRVGKFRTATDGFHRNGLHHQIFRGVHEAETGLVRRFECGLHARTIRFASLLILIGKRWHDQRGIGSRIADVAPDLDANVGRADTLAKNFVADIGAKF